MMSARIGRLALVVVIVGAMLAVSSGPAHACSCAGGSPQQFLVESDAGFVGTLAEVDHGDTASVYTFDVEVWLNGDLDSPTVDVVSAGNGAACGFEIPDGGRAAVFLYRDGDDLTGGLCSTLDADVVLAAIDPAPVPGGSAVLAVTGTFEQGSFALLDAEGLLVGYRGAPSGFSPPSITPCADGLHAVAVGFPMVEIIDLRTLDVVDRVDTGDLQQSAVIEDVDCRDGSAESVRLLVQSGTGLERDVRALSAWSVSGTAIEAWPGARVVLVADGLLSAEPLDPGEQLVKIDADGTRRVLSTVERPPGSNLAAFQPFVPSPAGTRVAVSEVTFLSSGAQAHLAVRDSSSGDELVAVDLDHDVVVHGWLGDDTLVATEANSTLTLRDASTLEVRSELSGWTGFGATIVGDSAWAVNAGTVLRGSLETGTLVETTTLPSQSTGQVIALLEPVEVVATESQPLVTPRSPGQVADSESAPSVDAEPSAATAPVAGERTTAPSSDGSNSVPVVVIVVALILLSAVVGLVWRRSRRAASTA